MTPRRPLKLLGATNPPLVARVRDGTNRVYWGPGQPAQLDEPPDYAPPANWPNPGVPVRYPRSVRLFVVSQNPDGVTGSRVNYGIQLDPAYIVFGTGLITSSAYCTAGSGQQIGWNDFDDQGLILQSFVAPGAGFTAGTANALYQSQNPNFVPTPPRYSSVTPATVGTCGGSNPNAQARREAWEAAATAIAAAVAPIDLLQVTVDDTNYLSWASVGTGAVPINPGERPFIGGESLVVVVFVDDRCEGRYDPASVLTGDAGKRIAAAFPVFPKYRLVLVADQIGSNSFADELTAIAGAASLGGYGAVYRGYDGPSQAAFLGQLAGDFFT